MTRAKSASFLPPSFFQCPPLLHTDSTHLVSIGEAACIQVIKNARLLNGPIPWTFQSESHGVEIYSGHDPKAPLGVSTWCGVTELAGTIEEIASVFMSNNTTEYRNYCRVFAKDYMDAVNLYNLAAPTPLQPLRSVNVKWIAQQSPVPAVVKHRDWCFLESCYEFDVEGTRGWVQAYKSITLPQCPDLQSTFGVVRAKHHLSGFVFYECNDRPGFIRVVSTWQLDAKGKVPRWIYSHGIKMRCLALRDLDASLQESRFVQGMADALLPMHRLVPLDHRSRCFLCHHKFRFAFSRKLNCRVCGEVMCRKCCQRSTRTQLNLSVCVACVMTPFKLGDVIEASSSELRSQPHDAKTPLDDSFIGDLLAVPVMQESVGNSTSGSRRNDLIGLSDGWERDYVCPSPILMSLRVEL